MKHVLPVFLLGLAACASAEVLPTDRGTFLIAKKKLQAGSESLKAATAEVQAEAKDFCAKDRKVIDSAKFQQTVKYEKDEGGKEQPVVVAVSVEFKCFAK